MSEKVNIKSVNQMAGDSMIPQESAMQQQPNGPTTEPFDEKGYFGILGTANLLFVS